LHVAANWVAGASGQASSCLSLSAS